MYRGCWGWGDGGEGANGDRVLREAFIQDLRAERRPALGGAGGERSRWDCPRCLLSCVSPLLHRGASPSLGGLHWD